ncbi:family 20 glycosylhydrolase [Bremerella sp. JC770]|uniref:family 20 glycosylhydrolase n=1 Tax=Bremerella sp. JC770 TaxID=3232137 RepID=UPI0034594101
MMRTRSIVLFVLLAYCVAFSPAPSVASETSFAQDEAIQPFPVDYARLAFYPDRWKQAGADFQMLGWEGHHVVFVTKQGDYNADQITAFVKRLDDGWDTYAELIGKQPRRFKMINEKPVICAIPQSNLSCGYGCGYVGATGIEASAFYNVDWPAFKMQPSRFQHYYFYEMGRNYFVFGDRHSLFTTGFGVFMRYVCMDKLNCVDNDLKTRKTIEGCEEIYARSDVSFFDAFTNLGSGEKSNRLRNAEGHPIAPSDQPVMYAAAMLKLRKDYGGDAWVRKFYHRLQECKPAKANDMESAKTQVYNWLVCASAAAGRDLSPVFADRWRMPLTASQKQVMANVTWSEERLSVAKVVDQLLDKGTSSDAQYSSAPFSSPVTVQHVSTSSAEFPSIVPTPKSFDRLAGAKPFQFAKATRILVDDRSPADSMSSPSVSRLGDVLAGELEILTGMKPLVASLAGNAISSNDIVLRLSGSEGENEESYHFRSGVDGVVITANRYVGLAHGTSTFLQLIEPDSLTLPAVVIEDEPTDVFRNILIDVARSPISIGVLKDVVRLARLYKLRYIQLHLTDDQAFTFPFAPIIDGLKANGHRNYSYTRQELEELVDYAHVRGIAIIPEIELPGHSTKITQSGYLSPLDENHAQIADPKNFDKLLALVDDAASVFKTSPYFHMGGDESGAGTKLIPLVAAINQHLRSKPDGEKRRLLVWEGFHGAPTDQIPATGDDRVIVMAWESSYNTPWNLLKNDYQIINASWKPTYLTGGFGGLIHAGSTGGKRFGLEDIYRWNKDIFMHWEPGRPVYDDRGPNDPDRTDHEWNAQWIDRQDQIIGGMLVYWEQREGSVIHFIRERLPIVAQRLWSPEAPLSFDDFIEHAGIVDQRIFPIVQPVEILPTIRDSEPIASLYRPYAGESVDITLRNRTRIPGTMRYSRGHFSGSLGAPDFQPVPVPEVAYTDPTAMAGPFGLRAELVREDGTPVDGHSWAFFSNWPMRVAVTEYEIGGKTLPSVPDLASLPEGSVLQRYQMPYIRGLLQNTRIVGQMCVADFIAPQDGEYTFDLRTQSGHASFYIDLNQNDQWEADEALIRDTPNSEEPKLAKASLKSGQRYRLRLDHSTGVPRPVLNLTVTPPEGARTSIDQYLRLPTAEMN